MIPGAVHRSPGICLTAKENYGKISARTPSMKSVRSVIASNGVPSLQMRSVGSHNTFGREKEGRKEGNDGLGYRWDCGIGEGSIMMNLIVCIVHLI